ncbi:hypothetical protein J7L02_01200 [Candidatus Woesearchaeota archaeon]|nr:hypothetical protein [Candidatus Woesearchaeota archaeon]
MASKQGKASKRFVKQANYYKTIAKLRVLKLFEQAEKLSKQDLKLANNCVRIAWRLKLKYKLKLPSCLKKKFCKHCLTYWVFSKTVRKRVFKKRIVYTCLNCGTVYRYPITKSAIKKH